MWAAANAERHAGNKHHKAPGFALVTVMLVVALLGLMLPLFHQLSGEMTQRAGRDGYSRKLESRARMTMITVFAALRGHGGLPAGWQQADQAVQSSRALAARCAGLVGQNASDWQTEQVRLYHLVLADGSDILGLMRRQDDDGLPYTVFHLLGCSHAAEPLNGDAASHAEIAFIGQKLVLLGASSSGR